MIVHTPIPVNVTNRVVRIQPLEQHFQIINTDLNATVWAANNASIVPGQGTPIPSGTSLTWQSSGDVYLILGNDALSITAAKAAVIISYDVADWSPSPAAIAAAVLNSGVLVIDQPIQITLNGGTAGTFGPFDVSRYNSIDLQAGPVASVGIMTLQFTTTAGAVVHTEQIAFNANTTPFYGSFPVRGSQLYITTDFNIPYRVTSSNRPLDGILTSTDTSITGVSGNLLCDNNQIGIGAGAFGAFFYLATPYFGEIEVFCQVAGVAAAVPGMQLQLFNNNFNPSIIFVDGTVGTGSVFVVGSGIVQRIRIPCPGQQLAFRPYNAAGVAVTFHTVITPVEQQRG